MPRERWPRPGRQPSPSMSSAASREGEGGATARPTRARSNSSTEVDVTVVEHRGNDEDPPMTSRPTTSTPSGAPRSPRRTARADRVGGDPVEAPERRMAYMRCGPPSHRDVAARAYTPPYRFPAAVDGRTPDEGRSAASTPRSRPPPNTRARTPTQDLASDGPAAAAQRLRRRPLAARAATTTLTTALQLPDPGEYSAEAYSALHQRQFASLHEELDFLRRDFVASRRTLAVLQGESARLSAVLQEKVREAAELEEKVEWYRRQLGRLRGRSHRPDLGEVSVTSSLGLSDGGAHVEGGRLRSGRTSPSGRSPAEGVSDAEGEGRSEAGVGSRTGPGAAEGSRATSALWLYAATGAARDMHRRSARLRGDSAAADATTAELITELRRNLAKRDTALDQCRLEVGELKKARDELEREVRQGRLEATQATQEHHRTLSTLNEKLLAMGELEEKLREVREADARKEEELARLRSRCEVADLLGGHVGGGKGGDGGVMQQELLLDQVRTYRERWQAAEDRVDQLQQQLLAGSSVPPLPPAPASAATPVVSDAERLRMEDEVRSQLETIRRLQRKLEREQEGTAFREDQARQQRQADLRQHAMEVAALRDQLEAARGQLANEARDRESLVRQLRQATHTESMADTLQAQNQTLKQRLAEVNAELAQAHGQRRELEVALERETSERVRLAHSEDGVRARLAQVEQREKVLAETVEELRGRLGAAAGRAYAAGTRRSFGGGSGEEGGGESTTQQQQQQQQQQHRPSLLLGDGASLASERKGYTALVDLNVTLQKRLSACEEELRRHRERGRARRGTTPFAGASAAEAAANDEGTHDELAEEAGTTDEVACQREHLSVQVADLREELQRSRRAQAELVKTLQNLQVEYAQVVADNLLLASGAEQLWNEVVYLRAVQARRPTSSPQSSSRLRTRLQSAKNFATAASSRSTRPSIMKAGDKEDSHRVRIRSSDSGRRVDGVASPRRSRARHAGGGPSPLDTAKDGTRSQGVGDAPSLSSSRDVVITVTHETSIDSAGVVTGIAI